MNARKPCFVFASACSRLLSTNSSPSNHVTVRSQFLYCLERRLVSSNVDNLLSNKAKTLQRNGSKLNINTRILSARSFSTASTDSVAEISLLPRARRAFMYVPGDSEKMITKASQLVVDSLCLDMEDGVAESSKDKARDQIVHALDHVNFQPNVDVCVRINPVSNARAMDDLDALFTAQNAPQSICVPKIETQGEVEWLMNKIYGLAMDRPPNYKAHIVLICETPRAILNLVNICTELNELSTILNCNLVPDAIVFGSDDYSAAIGATRSEDATEVLYARQKLVMIAKMFSLQAIDMVYNDLNNVEGLTKSCLEGKKMGFNGKQVINPKQIETVQSCFSPSPEELQWATDLVAEFEKRSSEGVGAILFEGKMVDMPLVNQARNILRVKQKMNL